ncbi:MAG: hypothetical protein D6718_10675 [Acidobacteria bacterium]|nr:MAG: hypothetical protein D6718_10675 [Acidobacteriota bacterium]
METAPPRAWIGVERVPPEAAPAGAAAGAGAAERTPNGFLSEGGPPDGQRPAGKVGCPDRFPAAVFHRILPAGRWSEQSGRAESSARGGADGSGPPFPARPQRAFPREVDVSRDPRDRPPPPPDLGNREQVRRLKRAMERSAATVVRCQNCGHQQLAEAAFIGPRSACDRCGTALHSCRHCRHFDPKARHQCLVDGVAPVGDKWKANSCPHYDARLVLDATGKRLGGKGKQDAKALFDSLFKKP